MRTVFFTTLVIEVVDDGTFVFSDHQLDRCDCWLKKHGLLLETVWCEVKFVYHTGNGYVLSGYIFSLKRIISQWMFCHWMKATGLVNTVDDGCISLVDSRPQALLLWLLVQSHSLRKLCSSVIVHTCAFPLRSHNVSLMTKEWNYFWQCISSLFTAVHKGCIHLVICMSSIKNLL